MNKMADQYAMEQPDFALRPFVSTVKIAPRFEVLPLSTQSVLCKAPGILKLFDERLPGDFRGKTCVSVSLSGGELHDKSFPSDFVKILRSQNIVPARVELEVGESAVQDETAWRKIIPELAGLGFRVAVKRFIADSAGFDVLASPHIFAIKIAPQAIVGLADSRLARRYLKGLQSLARAINKPLIVDGVDTVGQALWVEAVGCQTFQGDFYGPRMGPEEARRFVLEGRHQVTPSVIRPFAG